MLLLSEMLACCSSIIPIIYATYVLFSKYYAGIIHQASSKYPRVLSKIFEFGRGLYKLMSKGVKKYLSHPRLVLMKSEK